MRGTRFLRIETSEGRVRIVLLFDEQPNVYYSDTSYGIRGLADELKRAADEADSFAKNEDRAND